MSDNKAITVLIVGVLMFVGGLMALHVVCMGFPGDPACQNNNVAQTQNNLQTVNIGGVTLLNGNMPTPTIPSVQCPPGETFNAVTGMCEPGQSCANGAINWPDCNQCPAGETYNPTTNMCETPAPVPGGVCGDGVVNAGEDCEPSVFSTYSYNKRQCKTANLIGAVTCHPVGSANECTFDASDCRACPSGQTVKNAGSWTQKRECVAGTPDPVTPDPVTPDPADPGTTTPGDASGPGRCSNNYVPTCAGLSAYKYGKAVSNNREPCMTEGQAEKDIKYKKTGDGWTKTGSITCRKVCSDGLPTDMESGWKDLTWFGKKCTNNVRIRVGSMPEVGQ